MNNKKYTNQRFPESESDDAIVEALKTFHENIAIKCGVKKYHENGKIGYTIIFPIEFLREVKASKIIKKIQIFLFDTSFTYHFENYLYNNIDVVAENHIHSFSSCFAFLFGANSYDEIEKRKNSRRKVNHKPVPENDNIEPKNIDSWVIWAKRNLPKRKRKSIFAKRYHPDVGGDPNIFKKYWELLGK